jgi:modulator of FtsH protease HflC
MRATGLGLLVGLLVVLFGLRLVIFKVNEWEQVVVTEFGKPKRVLKEPGLYFKMPDPIQKVTVFGKWLLDYDSSPDPIYTKDKKILKLDNYARWRIADPLLFLQALRTEDEGISRLDDIIYSELRKELGQHELSEVVSANREELMQRVTERSNEAAQTYGIEVIDVRVKRADLPPENEVAVYERMRAERNREAKAYRSEGEEQALNIRAETDLEAAQIMARAYEEAQRFRGQGDAEALGIYANAYEGAERFFQFTRTLEAYEKSIDSETVLVQPASSEFFKYLEGPR